MSKGSEVIGGVIFFVGAVFVFIGYVAGWIYAASKLGIENGIEKFKQEDGK